MPTEDEHPEDPFARLSKKPLDLLVLYNATAQVRRGDGTDELPDVDDEALKPLVADLESLGHRVRTLGVSYENLDALQSIEAELVLNLCEGSGLDGLPGVEVVSALEDRNIPFTGAGSWCYFLTSGKWRSKHALSVARVPTPRGAVMPSPDVPLPSTLRFPLFVKPRDSYGSIGVDEGSVVWTREQALARVDYVVRELNTHALVEEYVEGREITVGVLGSARSPVVLPPLEVAFGHAYDDKPQIRMFATKHAVGTDLYDGFHTLCPAPLTAELEARVRAVALAAYRAVDGAGYARVDMRLSRDGVPYVLEVNANCSLENGEDEADCGMLPLIGRAMGWSYPELLGRIIAAGLMREKPLARAPLAMRWHEGEALAHALLAFTPGARVMSFGEVYSGARKMAANDTLMSQTGRVVYVEPHVRHLSDARDPNLTVVQDGTQLWLEATRPIHPGELLTLDRSVRLAFPAPVRRRRAYGRPVHGAAMPAHLAARAPAHPGAARAP